MGVVVHRNRSFRNQKTLVLARVAQYASLLQFPLLYVMPFAWYIKAMDTLVTQTLTDLLAAIGISNSTISSQEIAGQTVYSVEAGDDGRTLIGSHGDVIHAVDHLVKKIVESKMPPREEGVESREPFFMIDVGGYRTEKIKELQSKAIMMADRARSFQYDVELTPMSAYERLIVHTTLQGALNVKTESQGEGRNRRVVIKYSAE